MGKKTTDEDVELLNELGVEIEEAPAGGRPAREQRIIAGFEEIERFVQEHGRQPEHGEERDIFERIYAVRLDSIRQSEECRTILKDLDKLGLLGADAPILARRLREGPSDEELLAELGVEITPKEDVTKLVHVRPRDEIKAAEEIAKRNPCQDFDQFRPIFEQIQLDLKSGKRQTIKFANNAEVRKGDLFVLDGQKLIVADIGEQFVNDYDRQDCRLRVVYDNGTESDLLVRSLQRALNKDKASRRITDGNLGPIFSEMKEEGDLPTGYIYVLRSDSTLPFIVENRDVIHKIGVTGDDVKKRVANAKKDPTYLCANVEIVRTYYLANINGKKLEALLDKVFSNVKMDVELKDRFGFDVKPQEWYLVPLPVIDEAIKRIMDGSIGGYVYDKKTARLMDMPN